MREILKSSALDLRDVVSSKQVGEERRGKERKGRKKGRRKKGIHLKAVTCQGNIRMKEVNKDC